MSYEKYIYHIFDLLVFFSSEGCQDAVSISVLQKLDSIEESTKMFIKTGDLAQGEQVSNVSPQLNQ